MTEESDPATATTELFVSGRVCRNS